MPKKVKEKTYIIQIPIKYMPKKPEIIKTTHRNKCELCDEPATIKFKEKTGDPYAYMCEFCFKDMQKDKKI